VGNRDKVEKRLAAVMSEAAVGVPPVANYSFRDVVAFLNRERIAFHNVEYARMPRFVDDLCSEDHVDCMVNIHDVDH
jgi:hypothetical protein